MTANLHSDFQTLPPISYKENLPQSWYTLDSVQRHLKTLANDRNHQNTVAEIELKLLFENLKQFCRAKRQDLQ